MADGMSLGRQQAGQLAGTLTGPPKRGHRTAPYQSQSKLPTLGPIGGRARPTSSVRLRSAVLAQRGEEVEEGSRLPDRWSDERIRKHGRYGQHLLVPIAVHRRQRQGVAAAHSGAETANCISARVLLFCTFPELSASCDSAHEALNEPADFWAQAPY